MRFRSALIAALVAAPLVSIIGCAANTGGLLEKAQGHFKPIAPVAGDGAKVELGRKLFFDPRLSASGAISCNSCHNLASYGADNLSTSLGHKAQRGGRNAPTVMNAGLHLAQFWDGRAADLAAQAKGPILNPGEMAMPSAEKVEARIRSIPGYGPEFKAAFGKEDVTYDRIAEAIAAFEGTLVTPSRFDRFLAGDTEALSAQEQKGLKTFMDKGCVSCHSGPAVGGGMYQKFGLVKPYAHQKDLGRYELTKQEADKFVFKVPSLRNISHTYPYFHDGQVWKLDEAVKVMAETQLGQTLTDAETGEIVAFLDALTGEVKPHMLKLPVLPPSGPETEAPAI